MCFYHDYVMLLFLGKPNILSVWVQNSVGLTSFVSSAAVVIDTTPPDGGIVTCPTYVSVSL